MFCAGFIFVYVYIFRGGVIFSNFQYMFCTDASVLTCFGGVLFTTLQVGRQLFDASLRI
jgi:hypothetical protein